MTKLMILVALAATAPVGTPVPFPRTQAETASERPIVLPDATAGRIGVLIVGFSKKSADVTGAWEQRVLRDYGTAPRVAVFRVAVLESVPKLLRGFVRGRIEKNVAPERRENFVLLFQLEDRWKSVVQFQAPDDAYLLVVAPDGTVVWRGEGGTDLAGYDVLKAQIEPLLRRR